MSTIDKHGVGNNTFHTASTLAEVNALVSDLIATYGALRDIGIGTAAQRPAAIGAGRLWYATDTGQWSYDSGTWDDLPAVPGDHAATHTDGTDDIQSATNSQKGLATPTQITELETNTTHRGLTNNPHATDLGNLGTGTLAELNALVTDLIATYGGIRDIGVGTLAQRPAFGTANRFFYTTDEQSLYRDTGTAWEALSMPPDLHAASHQNGGGDEISVAGLSGELADPQPPKTHAATHTNGTDDIQDATNAQKGLMTAALVQEVEANTAARLTADTVVNIPNGSNQAAIQAIIDAQPKNLGGFDLTFQFADGTYTIDSYLNFEEFYGGILRCYGNNGDPLGAGKSVIIDFAANGALYFSSNCDLRIYYLEFHYVLNQFTGLVIDAENGASNNQVSDCVFQGVGGTTRAIQVAGGNGVLLYNAYFSNIERCVSVQQAAFAHFSQTVSYGTNPDYLVHLLTGGRCNIDRSQTQATAAVQDILWDDPDTEAYDCVTAAEMQYDNTTSGLTADRVQAAIDELESTPMTPASHAASHTNGTDDIQDATAAQKGLATAAQITKLDGIEALADVTDTANVDAAGATMNADTSLVGNAWFLDDDNMTADDATKVASQQSIKAYVDAKTQGAKILQGDWDAATNTPDITTTTETGYTWRVSVAGSTNLGGITDWQVNDLAVKTATGWLKIDNSDTEAVWGGISGTLSNQTDLQSALDGKAASTHASQHQHGGADEVATATAAANAIPKADGTGVLDGAWIADASTTVKGKVELATDGENAANVVVQGNDSRLSDARTPTAHAASHTNGTDDIQSATNAQKGLATAAHITDIESNNAHRIATTNPHATDLGNLGTGTLAELNALITDLIATYGAVRDIGVGTIAQRPAAGTAGRFWWATDNDLLYYDNGVSWDTVNAEPELHAASHQNGGADEINVAGLSGELADPQPPKTHAASHTDGTDDIQSAGAAQKGLVDTAAQTFAGQKTFSTAPRITPLNSGDEIITTDTNGELQESGAKVQAAPVGGSGFTVVEYASAPVNPPAGFLWVQAKDGTTKTLNFHDGTTTYSVDLSS